MLSAWGLKDATIHFPSISKYKFEVIVLATRFLIALLHFFFFIFSFNLEMAR